MKIDPDILADQPTLITVGDAARLFGVSPKTIVAWCGNPGIRLTAIRTPGGHRRLRLSDVMELRDGSETSRLP